MALNYFSVSLVLLFCLTFTNSQNVDVSDIIFQEDLTNETSNSLCSTGYPSNVNVTETSSGLFFLQWEAPTDTDSNTDFTGYQVLYWRASSSSLSTISVRGSNNYSISMNLTGFTTYYFSVRGVCEGGGGGQRYGPASSMIRLFTSSRGPNAAPIITNYETPYRNNYSLLQLVWRGIGDDQWNGQNLFYEVSIFDVTPDYETQHQISVPAESKTIYSLSVQNLMDMHYYLMYVHAVSSGGRGPPSNPLFVLIQTPTVTPTPEPNTISWEFYIITIPALIVLAILIALCLLCTKLCLNRSRKNVAYVRDINKNLEDGTLVSSRFKPTDRFELIRISQQNRPLPPNPHTPTPSATSVNARLILKDYSPPFDHSFPEYPPPGSYPSHPHPYHHPIDTDMEQRLRSTSVSSPHYPTLSQPLSDMSSVTPSSVNFNEVTVSGRYPSNRSPVSPANANPYEVPNESETGHHSVSPPGHAHSRRPHTANAMMSSQPAFYPSSTHHHTRTPPMTQSNVELFQFNRVAPPVPPHRSNTIIGVGEGGVIGGLANIRSASPRILEEGDYSEIPDSPQDEKGHPHITPVSSSEGPYNSYSDIPNAVSPAPQPGDVKVHSSSSSESISSFSTDSQSTSPARRREGPPSYHHHNGSLPRCGSQSTRPMESYQEEFSQESNPYLSPTSVKSSSTSSTRTSPPTTQ